MCIELELYVKVSITPFLDHWLVCVHSLFFFFLLKFTEWDIMVMILTIIMKDAIVLGFYPKGGEFILLICTKEFILLDE